MTEWWKPSQPNDIKPIPWISPAATAYLDSILRPNMDVIEHGSGGSTLFMADRVKRVTAVETNAKWQDVVAKRAPDNVRFVDAIKTKRKCDLLFLDGEPVTARRQWLADAQKLVKAGGWIVLDNANRPEYMVERQELAEFAELVERVDGNEGNTKFLVTEFWRVKGKQDEDRQEPTT